MSKEAVDAVREHFHGLDKPPRENGRRSIAPDLVRLVFYECAHHAKADGSNMIAGIPRLSRYVRHSPDQVRRALQALAAEGWLEVEGETPGRVTRYRVNLAKLAGTPCNVAGGAPQCRTCERANGGLFQAPSIIARGTTPRNTATPGKTRQPPLATMQPTPGNAAAQPLATLPAKPFEPGITNGSSAPLVQGAPEPESETPTAERDPCRQTSARGAGRAGA